MRSGPGAPCSYLPGSFKDNAEKSGSSIGSMGRRPTSLEAGMVIFKKCCKKVSTPKLVSAEPKIPRQFSLLTSSWSKTAPAPSRKLDLFFPAEVSGNLRSARNLRVIKSHLFTSLCCPLSSWKRSSTIFSSPVINASEFLSGANGPVDGTGGNSQLLFNIIHSSSKRYPWPPVHLIDKGKDRDMAHGTYLEQLSCLRLHAPTKPMTITAESRGHQRPVASEKS